jgi:hypothetical protein
MDDILLVATLDEFTSLCVSELSDVALAENGIVSIRRGLFLYESINRPLEAGIRVLAQVPDEEAAHRLADVFRARVRA